MLETLREVTEEEYRDALARDAARTKSAEESMLRDAIPEESGINTVTIIVDPRENEEEDMASDASHVQQSRCIHPLRSTLGRIRMSPSNPSNIMDNILKLPKQGPVGLLHRNLLDTDSYGGASSIQESMINPTGTPHTLQGRVEDKSYVMDELPISTHSDQSSLMTSNNGDGVCDDLGFASSNMQERFVEKQNPKLKLKSLLPTEKLLEDKRTSRLKNILKLKDVDFIHPGSNQNSILPKLEFKPLIDRQSKKPLDLNELFNGLKLNFKKNSMSKNAVKPLQTEILDSVPNTSNVISKQNKNIHCDIENRPTDLNAGVMHSNEDTTIDLPDSIFNPSETVPNIFINNERSQEDFKENDNTKTFQNEPIIKNTNIKLQSQSTNPEVTNSKQNENNAEFMRNTSQEKDISGNNILAGQNIERFNDLQSDKDSLVISNKLSDFTDQPIDYISDDESLFTKTSNTEDASDDTIEDSEFDEHGIILDNNDSEMSKLGNSEEIKSDPMSITDLQNLSNSLLKLSNKLEDEATKNYVVLKDDIRDLNEDEEKLELLNISVNSNRDNLRQTQLTPIDSSLNKENSCDSNSKELDSGINLAAKEKNSEMDTGESEHVISKILKNPMTLNKGNILRDTILEPSSLEDFTSEDNSNNIFSSLPSLNDITDQLSGIFGTNDVNSNEDVSPKIVAETCPVDENEKSLMSAEPSTLNTRLAPLEDINLELFQWKPLGTEPDILKSFRAKLNLPKNLEIKPMRLQSTVGNKGNLLGTTLSVDSKEKPKSRLNSKSLFNNGRTNIYKIPKSDILNLDEFTSTLRDNAQNLLNRGRELVPYNLEALSSIETLTENLRTHAESAVKNLQQNVESTFKNRRPNNFFSDHLSRPNDILERIANVREDFNDKIIGLHHDLNDRLTTLHENIFDQARFMSNRIPVMKSKDNNRKNNVQNLRKSKSKPLKLLTAESISEPVQIINDGRNKILDKDGDILNKNSGAGHERSRLRPYKSTSNIHVPKSVEIPKLEHTLNKPPALSQARLKTNNIEPIMKIDKQPFNTKYRSLLRKEVNPFKDSKFKITFATTTQASTTPMSKPNILTFPTSRLTSSLDTEKNGDFLTNRGTSRIPKLKSSDTNFLPSEKQLSKVAVPNKLLAADSESSELDKNVLKSVKVKQFPIRTLPYPTRHSLNSNDVESADINRSLEDQTDEEVRETIPFSPVRKRPNNINDRFLTQVREAIKSRKVDDAANKDFRSSDRLSAIDMARSAPENKETLSVDKHLKENVTYKCKMICSRE